MDRLAGILLHITSLPGREGIGTYGPEAHQFLEIIHSAGLRLWQILPTGPTSLGDSPFQGPSVMAGNPNLISLESLVKSGDLPGRGFDDYLREYHAFRNAHNGRSESYAEFGFLWQRKLGFESREGPLRQAYSGFLQNSDRTRKSAFEEFVSGNKWVEAYATFMALKEQNGFEMQWNAWPQNQKIETMPDFYKYLQFVFDEQATLLKGKADELGIKIIGDMAIYPGYDSAEVWQNPGLFQLDDSFQMKYVAGVPPDYFSENGQRWGNPLPRWGISGTEQQNLGVFKLYAERLARLLKHHHKAKIDHFRGVVASGRVPAAEATARNARWVTGPGAELFYAVHSILGYMPEIIAEDLGIITPAVTAAMNALNFPGMRVFQFADYRNPSHMYLPHMADRNSVMYTGTHDNGTITQWLAQLQGMERDFFMSYLKEHSRQSEPHLQAVEAVLSAPSGYALAPMQDFLGLGPEARMNDPSQSSGQWRWRITTEQLCQFGTLAPTIREMIQGSYRIFRTPQTLPAPSGARSA